MADASQAPECGIGALSKEFRDASDDKLLKVTRMIDLLPDRGPVDGLLQPVRSRLAILRPPRPLTLQRLLFTPFDPIMVAGRDWHPGDFTVPRPIVLPLSALLLGRVGLLPAPDPSLLASNPLIITRVGAPLWQKAASCLQHLPIPASWTCPGWQEEQGVTAEMLAQLLPALSLVLRHAVLLRTLGPVSSTEADQAVTSVLADAARSGALAWGIMLALLFEVIPPDRLARLTASTARSSGLSTPLLKSLECAITDLANRMAATPAPPLLATDGSMTALTTRLDALRRVVALQAVDRLPADLHQRLATLRAQAINDSRETFSQALAARVPAATPPGPTEANEATEAAAMLSNGEIQALEADLRQLRAFAAEASLFGRAGEFEQLLDDAACRYAGAGEASGLTRVERMRATELLVGSEKAAAALGLY